jgi:Fe-S-cluster containining protein
MKKKCENCGKCCLETEMIVSRSDIDMILKNDSTGLSKHDFILENEFGYSELRNIDGHCTFFEPVSKLCKIYEYRPNGCRFYPMIYDFQEKNCTLDSECPRINLFYRDKETIEKTCKSVQNYLKNQLNLDI